MRHAPGTRKVSRHEPSAFATSALHRITTAEFLSGEYVPDAIALAAHPMDRHAAGSSAQSLTFLKRPGVIPLSALIADRCPNLLAAGGLVAAEPEPFASIRVQAQCMATGQAAGTAAAAAARGGAPVQALDRIAIRHQLETAGAITSAPEQADCSTPSPGN